MRRAKERKNDDSIRQIFFGEGQEDLTDELIKELVEKKGFPEKDLREMRELGARYCRPRNSIIFPPEIGCD